MRIIAGRWKGHRLATPKGKITRPTPDRVREALFSILGETVEAAHILDLFAGTGCLGLEALSRGASHCTFVEKDRRVVSITRKNIEKAAKQSTSILNTPAAQAIRMLQDKGLFFDIAFLDPPYQANLLQPTLTTLLNSGLVRGTGTIVCEHHSKTEPPTATGNWELTKTRKFGDVTISFLQATESVREKSHQKEIL